MEIKILNLNYRLFKFRNLLCLFASLLIFTLLLPSKAKAQSTLTGIFKNYHAAQTTGNYEILSARNRLQFQLTSSFDRGNFFADIDFVHRYQDRREFELSLKEAYVDLFFSDTDLRVGKQNILWGRANGGFVTDILTPVDLREFLTQDPEDLRIGLTSLNAIFYNEAHTYQIIIAPLFQKDLIPNPSSRWFPVQTLPSPLPVRFADYDFTPTLSDAQFAFKYSNRSLSWLDLDLKLLRWKHPMPAYAINVNLISFPDLPSVTLRETYNNSLMAGISASIQAGSSWTFTLESLYVQDRLFTFLPVPISLLEEALTSLPAAIQLVQQFDLRDDGYIKKKPWLNSMIGVQTEMFSTTVSAQFYLETIFNYDEEILSQQYFPYATLLATRAFSRDRLRVLALSRYNFYAEDYWLQMQGVYEISDGLEFSLGTNLFAGEDFSPFYGHFTFAQFRQNSFLFAQLALFF
ncbi:MAG: hypothetical protein EA391_03260 [Balneolaceae bacterium]|nr:MAG: hypothetical protein EA391_03260 [Balneolaceae bacterium]